MWEHGRQGAGSVPTPEGLQVTQPDRSERDDRHVHIGQYCCLRVPCSPASHRVPSPWELGRGGSLTCGGVGDLAVIVHVVPHRTGCHGGPGEGVLTVLHCADEHGSRVLGTKDRAADRVQVWCTQ